MDKIIALLPVKKDSERIKSKNFRLFDGKPLYQIMLQKLEECEQIQKIVVNTDSEVICEYIDGNCKKGVILKRPDYLCGNHITANSLIEYDLSKTEGDYFLQTHCTNPILSIATIRKAIAVFYRDMPEKDALFTVNRVQKRVYDKNSNPVNHDLTRMLPTQDLDPLFVENSNLFLFTREAFSASSGSRLGTKPQLMEISDVEALDIDYPEDFTLAELVYRNRMLFPSIFGK